MTTRKFYLSGTYRDKDATPRPLWDALSDGADIFYVDVKDTVETVWATIETKAKKRLKELTKSKTARITQLDWGMIRE